MDAINKMLNGKWQYAYDLSIWKEEIDGYSIDGCAVLSESNLAFVFRKESRGTKDEIKLIHFFRDEKEQFRIKKLSDVNGRNGEITAISSTQSLWMKRNSKVCILNSDGSSKGLEKPIPNSTGKLGYGIISDVKKINNSIYAAGGKRHIFKREGSENWVEIGKESKGLSDLSIHSGFNTLGGTAEDDIYAGGKGGDFWHFNGKQWRRIDLPVNVDIYKIEAVSKDLVYVACGGGFLLEGSQDNWRIIKKKDEEENFYQMVQFQKEIYVSTQYRMYKLVKGKLEECMPSKQNVEIEMFCHHYLSANDDIMLMCGQRSAAIFDGEFWLPFAPRGPLGEEVY